jgi:hypothetical protein
VIVITNTAEQCHGKLAEYSSGWIKSMLKSAGAGNSFEPNQISGR